MTEQMNASADWRWTWVSGPLAGQSHRLRKKNVLLKPALDDCGAVDGKMPSVIVRRSPYGLILQSSDDSLSVDGNQGNVFLLREDAEIQHACFSAHVNSPAVDDALRNDVRPFEGTVEGGPHAESRSMETPRDASSNMAPSLLDDSGEIQKRWPVASEPDAQANSPDVGRSNESICQALEDIHEDIEQLQQLDGNPLGHSPSIDRSPAPVDVPSGEEATQGKTPDGPGATSLPAIPTHSNSPAADDEGSGSPQLPKAGLSEAGRSGPPTLSSVLSRLQSDTVDTIEFSIQPNRGVTNSELLSLDSFGESELAPPLETPFQIDDAQQLSQTNEPSVGPPSAETATPESEESSQMISEWTAPSSASVSQWPVAHTLSPAESRPCNQKETSGHDDEPCSDPATLMGSAPSMKGDSKARPGSPEGDAEKSHDNSGAFSPETLFEIDSIREKLSEIFNKSNARPIELPGDEANETTDADVPQSMGQKQSSSLSDPVSELPASIPVAESRREEGQDASMKGESLSGTGDNRPVEVTRKCPSVNAEHQSTESKNPMSNEPINSEETMSSEVVSSSKVQGSQSCEATANHGNKSNLVTASFLKQYEESAASETGSFDSADQGSDAEQRPSQVEVATSSQIENDSDDMEDYMNLLLKRLRGDDAPAFSAVKPAEKPNASRPAAVEKSPVVATEAVAAEPLGLLNEEDYRPQKMAPERNTDMNALRKLANESTRNAVSSFVKRRNKSIQAVGIASIGGGIALSALFFSLSQTMGDPMSIGGITCVVAAVAAFGFQLTAKTAKT